MEIWEKIHQEGKYKYAFKQGTLRFGIATGLISIVCLLLAFGRTIRVEIYFLSFATCLAIGFFWGCMLWNNLEQKMLFHKQNEFNNIIMGNHTKDPEIKEFTGKLIEEPFVNKAGRVIPNMGDLFFKIDEKEYFIKLMEGNVLRVDLEKHLNQTIKVKCYLTSGLWDTDNPEMQSRIGEYMVILEIL